MRAIRCTSEGVHQTVRRIHYAILIGQLLSYALIVTFIFADATFGFVEALVGDEPTFYSNTHYISACLIGMVGAASIWISIFYMRKSEAMRDWIVLCAWTQRVKSGNRWISITEFLSDSLGYNVTHGMSEEVVDELRSEIDTNWKKINPVPDSIPRCRTRPTPPQPNTGGQARQGADAHHRDQVDNDRTRSDPGIGGQRARPLTKESPRSSKRSFGP